jgi:hypothetical protein
MREGQLHTTICFPGLRHAMVKVEHAVRLRVGKQFQKFRAMNIVALDAKRGPRRGVDALAKRCSQQEAGNRRSYRLDSVCEADPLQHERGVRMDGHPGANLTHFTGLVKDSDVQSTRPQRERGRQAANPAANDCDSKVLRHHLSRRLVTRFNEAPLSPRVEYTANWWVFIAECRKPVRLIEF